MVGLDLAVRDSGRYMRRRSTRKKRAEAMLIGILVAAAVGCICLYQRNYQTAFWLLLYAGSFTAYVVLTTIPTRCNVITERRRPCTRKIRGVLFGCQDHTWERFWSLLGVRRSHIARELEPAAAAPSDTEGLDDLALRNGVVERRRSAILFRLSIFGTAVAFVSMITDLIGLASP